MKLGGIAAIALAFVAATACKDDDGDEPAVPATAAPARDAEPVPPTVEELAIDGDAASLLDELEARPAWQAVIDRAQLLARRGDQGAVYGILVESGATLWLVDDQQGGGALAIRVRVPAGMAIDAPFRAVLWGAWTAEENRWIWRATRVAKIGAATAPERAPGLTALPGELPADATVPSAVSRRGGAIAFFVAEAPRRPGDGWLVADAAGGPATARVFLPGQRESYGGQDYRSDDERWRLDLGGRYAARVGRSRPPRGDALPSLFATEPPIAVPAAAPMPAAAPAPAEAPAAPAEAPAAKAPAPAAKAPAPADAGL